MRGQRRESKVGRLEAIVETERRREGSGKFSELDFKL